ncbi:CBS domain-containing protein [Archaeoglobus sp.]|uniref:CBS domain-containing protein n=1 Tax=Archaeoglobus sp. TaxID=1872626 RepID=UPI0024AB7BC0|nr:CBS domain-containing protein [Archaeoglobus sp.]MDI3498547.1 hypothetical protein [Archaeoglobus sp.]
MRASFKIFRVFGIDVEVHISLLILLVLLIYAFSVSPFPYGFANFPLSERIILSSMAAVGLFASILAHELGHSLVARRYGVRIRGIMLFIFGGVAMMDELPKKPREELVVAISGPATSFGIAVVSALLSSIPVAELSAFFLLFGYLNFILAIFNLIPAFPMDGGRILRSFLAEKRSYAEATKIAAEIGRALAIFMAIFGIFTNPWLILIALFVYIGANEEERLVLLENVLGRVRVADVMNTEVVTVTPEMTVSEVIDLILKTKHLGFPVVEGERLVGIITLHDIIGVEPEERVGNIMSREVVAVSPNQSAFEAFKIMSEMGIGRLPVVEHGRVVGIVSRSDLMRIKEILEALEVMCWRKRGSS